MQYDQLVGGWFNSENEQCYFDRIKVFKDTELEESIVFTYLNKQLYIYDLTEHKAVKVE